MRAQYALCKAMLMALVLGGCAYTVFAEPEPFLWSAPGGQHWILANTATFQSGGDWGMPTYPGQLEEYVREGDSLADWEQLASVVRTYVSDLKSKKDVYDDIRKARDEKCPGSTRWNVVEDSPKTLIFESWAGACMGFAPHYELATIVQGTRDRVKFAFAHRGTTIDPGLREEWIKTMREAHFGTAPGS